MQKYKISGYERKRMKKRLSALKSYQRTFWPFHQMDKDMHEFIGDTPPVSDSRAKELYTQLEAEIKNVEAKLLE